jgi:hypothetical protein
MGPTIVYGNILMFLLNMGNISHNIDSPTKHCYEYE